MKFLFLEKEKFVRRLIGERLDSEEHHLVFNGESKCLFSYKELGKYDFVIGYNFYNPYHNEIIKKAKEKGVITVLLQDGIYEWYNSFHRGKNPSLYFPIQHDVFLCCGVMQQTSFIKNCNSAVVAKYIPEYLMTKNETIGKGQLNRKFDFVITTANSAYFNDEEFYLLVETINDIVKYLLDSKLKFCFRIFDSKLMGAIKNFNNFDNIIEVPISNVFENVRAVITTRSSLIIEAINLDLPVCEIIYRSSPEQGLAGWKVFKGLNYKPVFESMLSRQQERMNFQYSVIDEFTSIEGSLEVDTKSIGLSVLNWKIRTLIKLLCKV